MIKDEVERQFWIDQFNRSGNMKTKDKASWANNALKELQAVSGELYIQWAKALDKKTLKE